MFPTQNTRSEADIELIAENYQRYFPESYEMVMTALDKWTLTNKYAPTVFDLKNIIYEMVAPKQLNAEEAFEMARSCWRKLNMDTPEESRKLYDELPQEIKDCYSYYEMYEIKNMSTDYINNFEKTNFMKRYKEKQENLKKQIITSGKPMELAVKEVKLLEGKNNA